MPGLTVAEKTHWRDRIAARIDKRIEAIAADDPSLLERVKRAARQRALESLGLAELQAELDTVVAERAALDRRERRTRRTMLARVRRVAVEDLEDHSYSCELHEINAAVVKRQAIHEDELLAADATGQRVLGLRAEKDRLLDTVWLATSPVQIRQLWTRVGALLGDEPTELEREALAIAPVDAS
jgi:hypothetical protein